MYIITSLYLSVSPSQPSAGLCSSYHTQQLYPADSQLQRLAPQILLYCCGTSRKPASRHIWLSAVFPIWYYQGEWVHAGQGRSASSCALPLHYMITWYMCPVIAIGMICIYLYFSLIVLCCMQILGGHSQLKLLWHWHLQSIGVTCWCYYNVGPKSNHLERAQTPGQGSSVWCPYSHAHFHIQCIRGWDVWQ